jgi:hypothetical protein
MVDRLQQKAKGEIKRPGFEVWPSSDQLQLVGLRSWFRVEDAAWLPVSVSEEFAGARAVAAAAEPARVQYEFSDGLYGCGRQGVSWSETADVGASCRRDWEHTTEVEPQSVKARLVYEFDWEVFNVENTSVGTGSFTIIGQWSDTLDLVVGELGTVVTDGSSPSQAEMPRGLDMATADYQPPSGCKWGFLCAVGRTFTSFWNWGQEQWNNLSIGVWDLAGYIKDLGVGCFGNVLDALNAIKDVLVKLKDFAVDPIAFVAQQLVQLKALVQAIINDPGGFATALALEAVEADLLKSDPWQWAGKFGCQVALALFTGGGSLVQKFGTVPKLIARINDFISSKNIPRFRDDLVPDPGNRNRERGRDDRREDDDEGSPRCLIGNNSFPTGTLVRMASGRLKPIDQIEPGDAVMAVDPVLGTTVNAEVLYQWGGPPEQDLIVIAMVGGGRISATAGHEFWSWSDRAWKQIGLVEPGERLAAGVGVGQVAQVIRRPAGSSSLIVWDLDVSGPDSFLVHDGSRDLVVHNSDIDVEFLQFVDGVNREGDQLRRIKPLDGVFDILGNSQGDEEHGDYEQARNAALAWLEERGFKAEIPVYNRFPTSERGTRIIGWQTADGKVGYRVEWDERSGAHINVKARKEQGPHFMFPGDSDLVDRITRRLACR